MTEYVIEHYGTFKTKGCPDELIFGYFNDQPIPSNYYNFLNDDDAVRNNIPGTPVENALPDNEVVEDAVGPNDEGINDETIVDDNDSLDSEIDPPPKRNDVNWGIGQWNWRRGNWRSGIIKRKSGIR